MNMQTAVTSFEEFLRSRIQTIANPSESDLRQYSDYRFLVRGGRPNLSRQADSTSAVRNEEFCLFPVALPTPSEILELAREYFESRRFTFILCSQDIAIFIRRII